MRATSVRRPEAIVIVNGGPLRRLGSSPPNSGQASSERGPAFVPRQLPPALLVWVAVMLVIFQTPSSRIRF